MHVNFTFVQTSISGTAIRLDYNYFTEMWKSLPLKELLEMFFKSHFLEVAFLSFLLSLILH